MQVKISLVNKILIAVFGVFLIIYLPKYAGIDVYGQFMLILSYISILGPLMGVPLQEATRKEIAEDKLRSYSKKFFIQAFYLRIFINFIFLFVLYFIAKTININIVLNDFFLIFLLFLTINLSGISINCFEALHRNGFSLFQTIIEYGIKIILIIFFYLADKNISLKEIVISFVLGYGISTILSLGIIKHIYKLKFDKVNKSINKVLFSRYFYLSLSSISFLLLTNIDSIMISWFYDYTTLGMYNLGINLVLKPIIISSGIISGLTGIFHSNSKIEEMKKTYKKYNLYLIIINLFLAFLLLFFSNQIISLIYGGGYDLTVNIMRLGSFILIFSSIQNLNQTILINFGRFKIVSLIALFVAFLNIVLNLILNILIGVNGFVIATLISYITWSLLTVFYSLRLLSFK